MDRTPVTLVVVGVVVLALHVLGAGLLLSTYPAVVPLGVAAYALGLRHAFDADHITAIDNTTRTLMEGGRRPISLGFWFSLGHSTVVLTLTVVLALGSGTLSRALSDDGSVLHEMTGVVGTGVSALFLYVIAGANLVLLLSTWRRYRRLRRGSAELAELAANTAPRGLLTRVFGRVIKAVRAPWQMYPLGLLFGLGFDTATEVGLLVLAATTATAGLPWYALLALPILFAAGMSLLDTLDGVLMRYAYGWAFARPGRRLRYNLVVTSVSVVVAVSVGTVEIVSFAGERLGLDGPFSRWVSRLDLNTVGCVVVVLFAVLWSSALVLWRRRNPRTPVAADG
ncbi:MULTISPECIES: HoxN/HupN/NixA family nickel/cobalt transporter [Amycolatopsis]|uniref:Nickel/cobalt efflux system n=2 Tax=Amycolatopsis TaxID=1813 RepID=A0A1I3XG03_9PSEU|nr:HoxN/HupN/NixA family nickel/cobalt transporter [Amycolatopsis sacchari]SFK18445.1 high-affinity nickel-transport protein [Amycolatopsis sacchari]